MQVGDTVSCPNKMQLGCQVNKRGTMEGGIIQQIESEDDGTIVLVSWEGARGVLYMAWHLDTELVVTQEATQ